MTGKANPGGQRICPERGAAFLATPVRRLLHSPEKILEGLVLPGQTVADLGAGPGFFTIPMARMVGEDGRVLAADLQPAMLQRLARRAERAGVRERIQLIEAAPTDLQVRGPVDFAFAFYMVHEVPDVPALMRQVAQFLAPGGKLLIAEPKFHVPRRRFEATLQLAEAAGLRLISRPRIVLSHTALLQRQ